MNINNYNPYTNIENIYAYTAGLIDGEGCIDIKKDKRHKGSGYNYKPSITIAMRDKKSIELVSTAFPQQINIFKNCNNSFLYNIRYLTSKTMNIIDKCYKYFQVKKNLCDIVKELQLYKTPSHSFKKQGNQEIFKIITQKLRAARDPNYDLAKITLEETETIPYNEQDLAYIAALIDGEGSLGIYNVTNKTSENMLYSYHHIQCRLQISMNNLEGIKKIQSHFGNNITFKNNKKAFLLHMSSEQKLISFLNIIYNFLILKKEQCRICLYYLQNKSILTFDQKQNLISECQNEKAKGYIGFIFEKDNINTDKNRLDKLGIRYSELNQPRKPTIIKQKTLDKRINNKIDILETKTKSILEKIIINIAKYQYVLQYCPDYLDNRTARSLDCSLSIFKSQLESKFLDGMQWEGYDTDYEIIEEGIKIYEYETNRKTARRWKIDFKIPIKNWDVYEKDIIKKILHFDNLQPVWI